MATSKRVDVFTREEGMKHGYFCIKIPYLFSSSTGRLIALGEARYDSCSDFTGTDLVMKTSDDFGQTWSSMRVFFSNTSKARNISTVIGNAAPVQIRATGRILVPFCRNNLEVWQMHSDDDGNTWSAPQLCPNAVKPEWVAGGGALGQNGFIGTGPPGGLQLQSGRLIVPSYHSVPKTPHVEDGSDTRGHILINDDPNGAPDAWRVGAVAPGWTWTNEEQAVELEPNHLVVNARGELTHRIEMESFDGGETLGAPHYIDALVEPLGGCEASTVYHPNASKIFFSGSSTKHPRRFNMSVWTSDVIWSRREDGNSTTHRGPWKLLKIVDPNRTAYSSLVILNDAEKHVGLLYERSDLKNFIFLPTAISFEVVW